MQAKLMNRSVEQAIAAIEALDLEPIKLRVMDAESGEGWTSEYADRIELGYRNYLRMLVKHPEDVEDIVVSKEVDEFWHAHILHTREYTEDCARVFGAYLHHTPHIGARTSADVAAKARQVEKTRRLYEQESAILSGAGVKAADPSDLRPAGFCGASIRAELAAFCGAAIGEKDVAFCGAAIEPEQAAFCGAGVRANEAAFCGASVRAENAAFCGAAIEAKQAAFCGAGVRASGAVFCGASLRPEDAAFCGAALKVAQAAFCGAGIASGTAVTQVSRGH